MLIFELTYLTKSFATNEKVQESMPKLITRTEIIKCSCNPCHAYNVEMSAWWQVVMSPSINFANFESSNSSGCCMLLKDAVAPLSGANRQHLHTTVIWPKVTIQRVEASLVKQMPRVVEGVASGARCQHGCCRLIVCHMLQFELEVLGQRVP